MLPNIKHLREVYPIAKKINVNNFVVPIPSIYTGRGITVVFPCSYEQIAKIIDNKNIVPIKYTMSQALISLTIFDFDSSPVGPYTELVYSIPVQYKPIINLPLIPLLFNRYGFHVIDIFQNTEIAVKHGNMLTKYPHNDHLIKIQFNETEQRITVEVSDEHEKIIDLQAKKNTGGKQVYNKYMTYFRNNEGFSKIRMDIYGIECNTKCPKIEIGSSKLANILSDIKMKTEPIYLKYYPKVIEINPVSSKKI